MKLTTQRLKKLIKEELEDMEKQEPAQDTTIYLIIEDMMDGYDVSGPAYRSRKAAERKAQELNNSNENPASDYKIVEVQLMD